MESSLLLFVLPHYTFILLLLLLSIARTIGGPGNLKDATSGPREGCFGPESGKRSDAA